MNRGMLDQKTFKLDVDQGFGARDPRCLLPLWISHIRDLADGPLARLRCWWKNMSQDSSSELGWCQVMDAVAGWSEFRWLGPAISATNSGGLQHRAWGWKEEEVDLPQPITPIQGRLHVPVHHQCISARGGAIFRVSTLKNQKTAHQHFFRAKKSSRIRNQFKNKIK